MTAVIDRFAKEWETTAKLTWRANAVLATDINPRPIRWAWPGWIAHGKLTILAGAGGTGKTTLTLGLIATLTSGGRWPDGEFCEEKRSAIIWSSEDDPADTIVPRLMAADADLSKVSILQGRINGLGEIEPFDPAKDIDLLAAELDRIGDVGMIMIDPIVSAVSGDMNQANQVRRALQGLVDLAERFDCAVLGITHFTKGSAGSNPADRVLGSQAFGALARTVLVAAKQEDSDLRVLARAKSNIAIDTGGCSYTIQECTVGDGIAATSVLWGDKINGTARDILADVESDDSDDRASALDEACSFLRDVLSNGPVPTKQLKSDADGNGISWATMKRAKGIVGAIAKKEGGNFGDGKQQWVWSLFTEGAQEMQKVLTQNREPLQENVSAFSDYEPLQDPDAEDV